MGQHRTCLLLIIKKHTDMGRILGLKPVSCYEEKVGVHNSFKIDSIPDIAAESLKIATIRKSAMRKKN